MCLESFHFFCRAAWHVIEPSTPYKDNWHIRVVCDHLEAVIFGRICQSGPNAGKPLRDLVINMPPRMMKSRIVSILFPAWAWLHRPGKQFFYASYAQHLADEHALLTKQLVESEWYQIRFGRTGNAALDRNGYVALGGRQQVRHFQTDAGGARQTSSVLGKATGAGGDVLVADDPHNVLERESERRMSRVIVWWTKAMSSRGNDPTTVARIVMMQRLHAKDLAGYCARTGYSVLKIPARYEGEKQIGVLGHEDPRDEIGEPLWVQRQPDDALAKLERDLGEDAAGQLQQRPEAQGGNIFPIQSVRIYSQRVLDALLARPENVHEWVTVWDFAFGKGAKRSFTCGQVWARRGADVFLIDQIRVRAKFLEMADAVRTLAERWPMAAPRLVEKKAAGEPIMDFLEAEIPGMKPTDPRGDKVARANAVSPFFHAGNVWIPHHSMAPWVGEPAYLHGQLLAEEGTWVHEHALFPNSANNDQVDCTSMALDHLLLQRWEPTAEHMTSLLRDDDEDDYAPLRARARVNAELRNLRRDRLE